MAHSRGITLWRCWHYELCRKLLSWSYAVATERASVCAYLHVTEWSRKAVDLMYASMCLDHGSFCIKCYECVCEPSLVQWRDKQDGQEQAEEIAWGGKPANFGNGHLNGGVVVGWDLLFYLLTYLVVCCLVYMPTGHATENWLILTVQLRHHWRVFATFQWQGHILLTSVRLLAVYRLEVT